MSRPQGAGNPISPLDSEQAHRTRKQFEAAWRLALEGAPEPELVSYLQGLADPERLAVREALLAIDSDYRARRAQQDSAVTIGCTVDLPGLSSGSLSDTTKAHVGATVELPAPIPPGPDAHAERANPELTIGVPSPGAGVELPSGVPDGTVDFALGHAPTPARPPPAPVERLVIAGYEILGELGRGGMGVVYKARQVRLDRVVALKMVLAGAHAGSDQLARFYTEAQAVGHLQHPNIVQIYEVGEHAGLPYFSLEFLNGGSLAEKLEGKPRAPKDAAGLVATLSRAMHYAHEHHVIHRDLKPANVLLTSSGVPKITDFGLAKRLEQDSSQTKSGAIMGTPSYMAPEQARGEIKEVGPLADVYSLGSMLYELLTGRPPFLADNPMNTLMQVLKEEPVAPTELQPKVPHDLETICLKCLQKEPRKRYSSAAELAGDLERFLRGEPILARPVSGPERLWRWCRRNPRVAVLSGAVLLLLVAVAIGSSLAALTIYREKKAVTLAWQVAERNEYAARIAQAKAEEAQREADKNAQIANEQSTLAVNSLNTVVTRIGQQLRDQPGQQKLRESLLNEAFRGLERVVNNSQSSSLVSFTKAAAYRGMGDIAEYEGRIQEAYQAYKQCQEMLEAREQAEPLNPQGKRDLAILYNKLGGVSKKLGDTRQTLDCYRKAMELREQWAQLEPENEDPKQALAESYGRLGGLLLQVGDPSGARFYFVKSLDLRRDWVAREPANDAAKQELAGALGAVGDVNVLLGDLIRARENFELYVEQLEQLASDHPENVNIQWNVWISYLRFAGVCIMADDIATAHEYFDKCATSLKSLLDQDTKNAKAKAQLSSAYYGLGLVSLRRGETAQAQEQFNECLKLRDELVQAAPQDIQAKRNLMMALARVGRYADAVEIALGLADRSGEDAELLYNLACCYAVCFRAAAHDSVLSEKYAMLAFDRLRSAVSHGFSALSLLATDPDLEPLRSHPDYKSFLQEIEQLHASRQPAATGGR